MAADLSGLDKLIADLAAAPGRLRPDVIKLTREAVRRGRDDARERISGQIRGKYLPHYAQSITHEVSGTKGEFGPDSSRPQGRMGRGVEFGSVNHPPLPHMLPAADALEQSVPDELLDLAERDLLP
jgi:hypothetical protein